MKSIGFKKSIYIDFGVENNDKDPEFKVADDVRISKYKRFSRLYFFIKRQIKQSLELKK